MQSHKIKKAPIILPLVVLILILGSVTFMNFRGTKAADEVTLGQQHLVDLNYQDALNVFTKVVSEDPNNIDARLGLCDAYVGLEKYENAKDILKPLVYTDIPNNKASHLMADIYKNSDNLNKAAILTQQIVNNTDAEEDKETLKEIITELSKSEYLFAEGPDRRMAVIDKKLYGCGKNDMGQLGIDPSVVAETDKYLFSGLDKDIAKVSCGGKTTYAVDTEGNLWAAGENRWGQMADGTADYTIVAGWHSIPCPGKVSFAVGTQGRLLVLLEDGSLWTAGAGNSFELNELYYIPDVISLSSNERQACALTSEGKIYISYNDSPGDWYILASNAESLSMDNDGILWLDFNGRVCKKYNNTAYEQKDIINIPDDQVIKDVSISKDNSVVLFQNGDVYMADSNNNLTLISKDLNVKRIYTSGNGIVLQKPDGENSIWFSEEQKLYTFKNAFIKGDMPEIPKTDETPNDEEIKP